MPADIFPATAGLIVADQFGGHLLRDACEHRLAAATRRSLTLRFARTAAYRLQALLDPTVIGGDVSVELAEAAGR